MSDGFILSSDDYEDAFVLSPEEEAKQPIPDLVKQQDKCLSDRNLSLHILYNYNQWYHILLTMVITWVEQLFYAYIR